MTDDTWTHPRVQEFADLIARDTGRPVTVDRVTASEWRIIAVNERVRMTVDYRLAGRGRLLHAGTTLTIDWNRQGTANGYHDFLAVFADPDLIGQDRPPFPEPTPDEPAPAGVIVDGALIPAELREAYELVADKFPPGVTVRFGRARAGWIISVDGTDFALRMNMTGGFPDVRRPHITEPMRPWKQRPVQLILRGEDLTDQVAGNLPKALDLIRNGPRRPDTPAMPEIAGPRTAPSTTNAVTVRKSTVIRR